MMLLLVLLLPLNLAAQPQRPRVFAAQDFRQFHSGAVLLLRGRNPYHPDEVWGLQRGQDIYGTPHVSVSPPPTFLPFLPFAGLAYRPAMWTHAACAGLLLLAVAWFWSRWGGLRRWKLLAALAGPFIWLPCGLLVGIGQITALPLAVFSAWLAAMRAGRFLLAGLLLPFVLVKPHLGLSLVLAGVAAMVRCRAWSGLLACAAVGICSLLLPLALRPSVYHDYLEFVHKENPGKWVTATLTGAARMAVGEAGWWAGYLGLAGSAVASVVLGWRWAARREDAWQAASLPAWAVAGSLHAFPYDFVLLLPGFQLALAAWLRGSDERRRLWGWLLLVGLLLAGRLAAPATAWWFAPLPWLALALICWPRADHDVAGSAAMRGRR